MASAAGNGGDGSQGISVADLSLPQVSTDSVDMRGGGKAARALHSSHLHTSLFSPTQLADVQRQLEQEVEHLSDSFGALRTAQAKFRACLDALQSLAADGAENKDTLVPLTASLYVPGKLADVGHVLVDVGTGYYVEKVRSSVTCVHRHVHAVECWC